MFPESPRLETQFGDHAYIEVQALTTADHYRRSLFRHDCSPFFGA